MEAMHAWWKIGAQAWVLRDCSAKSGTSIHVRVCVCVFPSVSVYSLLICLLNMSGNIVLEDMWSCQR